MAQKQANVPHKKENMQTVRAEPEMTQRTQLVGQDIKTAIVSIPHILKKAEEGMRTVRRKMEDEKTQIKL